MASQKVDVNKIPKEVLGELQSLLCTSKKEYVVIGSSFYEIYPTSAINLMQVLAELMELLDKVRMKKIERIKKILTPEQQEKFDPTTIYTTMEDLISDKEGVEKLKALIPKVLVGVDEVDLEQITLGQLMDVMDKVIKINLDTLPPSYKKQVEQKTKAFTKKEDSATKNP